MEQLLIGNRGVSPADVHGIVALLSAAVIGGQQESERTGGSQ